LAAAADEIAAAGGEALVLPVDVANHAEVDAAADTVVARWGRIDVWINNAMVSVFAPIARMTADEFRRVTEVTYLGYVYGTCAALRHMRARDEGTIIQIGSALAYRSIPLQSAYCAAKSAIRGFTDSLRSELIHDDSKIAVCMVQLPAVNTPQFDVVRNKLGQHAQPVPPIYQPEAISRR
jgi:NAD(P)-dependent dehydrogenase (short-subunit alcohol dehydrogenase family)